MNDDKTYVIYKAHWYEYNVDFYFSDEPTEKQLMTAANEAEPELDHSFIERDWYIESIDVHII